MKSVKMLAILTLIVGLMVSLAKISEAVPMGTAFTYQGRLMDVNGPGDDLYDFEFKLFDDPCTGTQKGNTVDVNDLDVIDGYFTVELDFGSDVFNGDARWLDIGVRAGGSTGGFTTLNPRQEVTPVPYALQTRGIFVDSVGNVGLGTTNPARPLHIQDSKGSIRIDRDENSPSVYMVRTAPSDFSTVWKNFGIGTNADGQGSGSFFITDMGTATGGPGTERFHINNEGNVGIGTTSPLAGIHVSDPAWANIKLTDQSDSHTIEILTDGNLHIDGGGQNMWIDPKGVGNLLLMCNSNGNVGIGTPNPAEMLHINKSSGSLGLRVSSDAASYQYMNFGAANGYSIGRASDDKFFINRDEPLGTGVLRVLTVQADGKVGIGTKNPGTKLEVEGGPIKATGGLIIETRTSDPPSPITGQIWLRTDIP
jgi:hypothetical protein